MTKKRPESQEEVLQDSKKVLSLLMETLSINEVWLSTGISATGSLLMHLLLEAGMKKEALDSLKKALDVCAKSMGAKSTFIDDQRLK